MRLKTRLDKLGKAHKLNERIEVWITDDYETWHGNGETITNAEHQERLKEPGLLILDFGPPPDYGA